LYCGVGISRKEHNECLGRSSSMNDLPASEAMMRVVSEALSEDVNWGRPRIWSKWQWEPRTCEKTVLEVGINGKSFTEYYI
jgi:hypothetical protein